MASKPEKRIKQHHSVFMWISERFHIERQTNKTSFSHTRNQFFTLYQMFSDLEANKSITDDLQPTAGCLNM